MKSAAVVNFSSEPHSVEIREFDRPEPGAEDIVLAVEAVGVCGSDLHQWTSTHSWKVNYPVVLGHEFGGRIAAVGSTVKGWKEGDRVVSETAAVIDPDSPLSREGLYNLDPTRIGVWGQSAGAYLAVFLGVTNNNPDFEGEVGQHLDHEQNLNCIFFL